MTHIDQISLVIGGPGHHGYWRELALKDSSKSYLVDRPEFHYDWWVRSPWILEGSVLHSLHVAAVITSTIYQPFKARPMDSIPGII